MPIMPFQFFDPFKMTENKRFLISWFYCRRHFSKTKGQGRKPAPALHNDEILPKNLTQLQTHLRPFSPTNNQAPSLVSCSLSLSIFDLSGLCLLDHSSCWLTLSDRKSVSKLMCVKSRNLHNDSRRKNKEQKR